MLRLHEMGAKTVVISSSELGSEDVLVQLASRLNGKSHSVYYLSTVLHPVDETG